MSLQSSKCESSSKGKNTCVAAQLTTITKALDVIWESFEGGLAPPGFPLYRPSPLSLTMILCMMRNSVSKLRSERAKQKEGNMKTLANIIGCALRKVSVINVRRWRRKRKDVKDMTMLTWLPPIDCLKVFKTKNWAHQKCGQAKLPSNATKLASFTIFRALDFIYFVPSFLLNLAI